MELTFGEWLEVTLKKKKMKQSELAEKIGVKPPQVSRLISGDREPTAKILIKIATALRLPGDMVFGAAGLMPPNIEDEWDRRIKHLLKLFPKEEKEKIVQRLELEAQFYEQQRPTRSANKTRA